jgi:hypothetical protein
VDDGCTVHALPLAAVYVGSVAVYGACTAMSCMRTFRVAVVTESKTGCGMTG